MRFLKIIFILLLVSSCQDVQRTEKPEDLIPEDKMVDVLTELSLVQGARSYNKQMLEQTGLKPQEYLWQKFDIDSSQFARSSNYYARNYIQYQRIYDSVKERLEALSVTYDSIREEEERVRDSILAVQRGDTLDSLEDGIIALDTITPDTIRDRSLPEPVSTDTTQNPF